MSCLDNLIGIGRRQGDIPASGLYLEDINITLEDAEAIKGERYASGEELLNRVIGFSQISFLDDFKKQLKQANQGRKVFTANSVLENGVAGYYKDNLPTLAADATSYRGLSVRVEKYPYVYFHLAEVRLMTQVTGDIDVLVYDLIQNKLLDTITVSCIANEISTAVINKTYKTEKQNMQLAFIYDATNAAYKSDLNKSTGCTSCSKTYNTGGCEFRAVEFTQANPITRQNIKSPTGGTAGLSIQYSLNCDIEPFICSIKNELALAFLYYVGVHFVRELMTSARINATTGIPPEELEDKMNWFMSRYEDSMNSLIDGITLPNDRCFKCEAQVRVKVAIP